MVQYLCTLRKELFLYGARLIVALRGHYFEVLPMEHITLLPCPHCGGKAEIRHVNMADGIAVHAICHDCRASSPRILVCDTTRATHLAARAWNYRNPEGRHRP